MNGLSETFARVFKCGIFHGVPKPGPANERESLFPKGQNSNGFEMRANLAARGGWFIGKNIEISLGYSALRTGSVELEGPTLGTRVWF